MEERGGSLVEGYIYLSVFVCEWLLVALLWGELVIFWQGEMHDGIMWWVARVWINMADFNLTSSVGVWVCFWNRERERPREAIVLVRCVHWTFLLKLPWIFFLLKYSVFPFCCTPPPQPLADFSAPSFILLQSPEVGYLSLKSNQSPQSQQMRCHLDNRIVIY